MTACVAVLDVGKTNVKLVLFGADGTVLGDRSRPNRVLPGPPYPHADCDAIWDFCLDGLAEWAGQHVITHLAVTTHGATAALVDEDGLVLPVMDYEWDGPEQCQSLGNDFSRTLSPDLPLGLNLGRQLAWQVAHHPQQVARARHWLSYPQYWTWRLTGKAAAEVTSLGCHTHLWDPLAGGLSDLGKSLGLGRLLPRLCPAWENLGPLLPQWQARTGLGPDLRVSCGIHDSNAALLPHLARQGGKPFTLISTGTWVVVMAVGGRVAGLQSQADMLANVSARGQALPSARFMGGREMEALCAGKPVPCDLSDLSAILDRGGMALPAFSRQGGPYRDRDGQVLGPKPASAAERSALAALYAALMCLDLDARLGGQGPLIIEGSFAANEVFCAALAGLAAPRPVLVDHLPMGAAAGAALLACFPDPPPGPALAQVVAPVLPGLVSHAARWRSKVGGAIVPSATGMDLP